jgi:hypothetical protein
MDVNMTFDQNSEIPITFICDWGSKKGIDFLSKEPTNSKTKGIAFVASNCGYGGAHARTRYVEELMKYIKVDSYGTLPFSSVSSLSNVHHPSHQYFQAPVCTTPIGPLKCKDPSTTTTGSLCKTKYNSSKITNSSWRSKIIISQVRTKKKLQGTRDVMGVIHPEEQKKYSDTEWIFFRNFRILTSFLDYVTEKVMCALKAGSVPVYMGAPNVDEFLPGKGSVIKTSKPQKFKFPALLFPIPLAAFLRSRKKNHSTFFLPRSFPSLSTKAAADVSSADFKNPKELAEYLEEIMYSYRYNDYFAWKEKALNPSFKKVWSTSNAVFFFPGRSGDGWNFLPGLIFFFFEVD